MQAVLNQGCRKVADLFSAIYLAHPSLHLESFRLLKILIPRVREADVSVKPGA